MKYHADVRKLYVNFQDRHYTSRRYLVSNEYGHIAIVFADHEQEALDTIVDESTKLDSCMIDAEDVNDYSAHLGNASEPFDLNYIGIREL